MTIGGGTVLDPAPLRRRRRSGEALELLSALGGNDVATRVRLLVRESRLSGINVREICFRGGLTLPRLEGELGPLLSRGNLLQVLKEPRTFVTREAFGELGDHLVTALGEFLAEHPLHEGIGKEELKGCLPEQSDPRYFGALLAALVREGRLLDQRDQVKPAAGRGQRSSESRGVRDLLLSALRQGGAEPPTLKELGERLKLSEKSLREQLALLAREGGAVRVTGELYYAPEPLAALREQLAAFLKERGTITPAEFRELSGLSRKFMIPLLEYFDSVKLTIRVENVRRLRRG